MKNAFFFIVLMVLFVGCQNSEDPIPEDVSETIISPTHTAIFEVEGMMCQKGCGAAIRKGLYETGGVSEVEVVFNEENPVSDIKVYFDINKTTTEKMIHVIGGLAEMRYSAKLIKVTESTVVYIDETSERRQKHKLNRTVSVETSIPKVTFPNLTKLFSRLIN